LRNALADAASEPGFSFCSSMRRASLPEGRIAICGSYAGLFAQAIRRLARDSSCIQTAGPTRIEGASTESGTMGE
jgi:hypothetical protein